ncbi:MAG: hypothetical protein RIS29_1713 [Bacteroidota bacterium]|jgi:hypothetical protein
MDKNQKWFLISPNKMKNLKNRDVCCPPAGTQKKSAAC